MTEDEPYVYREVNDEPEEQFGVGVPFDPRHVDITVEPATISQLVDRIKHDEIDLFPEFQRSPDLWNSTRMSQLIESILIKLPLPAFYMDVANDDKWVVVDGLQRLSTFKRFMVDKSLKLNHMEFLKELEGKKYDDLDRVLQRRIESTQITLFKIRKGTPKKVLTNLFHRINTAGLKMTAQEIRHALNQGPATEFLNKVASEPWCRNLLPVSPLRMLNRELILRFIAFYRRGAGQYRAPLNLFLDDEMEYLNEQSTGEERNELESALEKGLIVSLDIFGPNYFSKALIEEKKRPIINRSLFEATATNIARLSWEQEIPMLMFDNKDAFVEAYKDLLRDPAFDAAITANTNREESVLLRHREIQKVLTRFTGHAY